MPINSGNSSTWDCLRQADRHVPNKRQHGALAEICESQRQFYNAALEERIDCYRKTGKGRTYFDQCGALTECRNAIPEMNALPLNIQRWTLRRLNDAYLRFLRRCKTYGKVGLPRFRSKERWRCFGFSEFCGITFDGKGLHLKGFPGRLRVHLCRPIPKDARIASCIFIRDVKGWSICFQIEVAAPEKKPISSAVGIDLGLTAFAYQSDGIAIPAPQFARRSQREMRRRSRAMARCKKGSNRRKKVRARFARLHTKIVNARTTWLHQQSARIVRSYDLVAVEDLKVANMVRNSHLARSISDASWSTFTNMLSYKAEKAGGTFVKVDPKMTSQICSGCGVVVKKGLAQRVHSCPDCGLTVDRDHNAAMNILRRAGNRPGAANVIQVWDERWPGNMPETLVGVPAA